MILSLVLHESWQTVWLVAEIQNTGICIIAAMDVKVLYSNITYTVHEDRTPGRLNTSFYKKQPGKTPYCMQTVFLICGLLKTSLVVKSRDLDASAILIGISKLSPWKCSSVSNREGIIPRFSLRLTTELCHLKGGICSAQKRNKNKLRNLILLHVTVKKLSRSNPLFRKEIGL